MSCNCHGKSGISVSRTSPYDQCSACAKKHTVKAWNLFHEFTYTDDNRDVISGQLRLAADHLMFEHRDTALLLEAVRSAFRNDHPECADRLVQLENQKETS